MWLYVPAHDIVMYIYIYMHTYTRSTNTQSSLPRSTCVAVCVCVGVCLSKGLHAYVIHMYVLQCICITVFRLHITVSHCPRPLM